MVVAVFLHLAYQAASPMCHTTTSSPQAAVRSFVCYAQKTVHAIMVYVACVVMEEERQGCAEIRKLLKSSDNSTVVKVNVM